eukprot:TRINITY_DN120999_c0_g1_i1.p1 TRINITY_DN120999_c0_g1~~TRINITY_DN120999_c0_g1_i1.p1  ORF type:complete len:440 (-),score=152.70 TRINITY_DN120999_c0_g1_i1:216-1535(-)
MPVAFITIKLPDGGLVHLDVELRTRVEEFRTILAPKCGVKRHRQRLVFGGRLLQDGRKLEDYGVERNATIHLLYAQGADGEASTGLDISQIPGNLGALQRHVLANPDILQQMLESPAMQSLLNDHDFLRSLIKMDPKLGKVFEHKELKDMLQDNDFMKQASESLRNPVHVRDVLRSTDRSMSQLEGLGGGAFDVLRQMCEDIRRPQEDSKQGDFNASMASMASTKRKQQLQREEGGEGEGSALGEDGMPGEEETGPQLPAWAGTFDTNAVAAMMQDQNMQHLLAQLVQTLPGPSAKVHPDDPFIDSGFLGQMFHSQTIQSMSKLQESIDKLSITADADGGGGGKAPKGGKAKKAEAEAPAQDSPGVLSGLHPNSPACNFLEAFQLYLQAEAESPEVRYKGQLQAMQNMGFTDRDACIQALHACDGNMSRAVDSLMASQK